MKKMYLRERERAFLQEVTEKATAKEWMAPVLAATGAKVVSENEHIIQAELDNDPDAGIYALKLRDQGISASFEFLRSKYDLSFFFPALSFSPQQCQ